MFEERKIEYIKPIRITDCSKNIINKEALFENEYYQMGFNFPKQMKCKGKGFIVLDFGKEVCGGVRILHNYEPHQRKETKIRIRFGESLSECYVNLGKKNAGNFQSIRDVVLPLPTLSDFSFGDTGFRFVRIDFLDNKVYNIPNIYAAITKNNYNEIGTFECDDKLVNEIFNTAKYTLSLCIQNQIWDGVKRDRLVWIGDMEPVVNSIGYIYGDIPVVDSSLTFGENEYPLPSWFGKIPSYNAWYIKLISDYYFKTGNKKFVLKRIDYINSILKQFDNSIDNTGNVDFEKANIDFRGYFIDWPTFKNEESKSAYSELLLFIFKDVRRLFSNLKLDSKLLEKLIVRLEKHEAQNSKFKQLLAFNVLTQKDESKDVFEKLIKGKAEGVSTFLSYYIFSAISKNSEECALEIMKNYYGSMLEIGATTFFEEHDIEWLKNSCSIEELPKRGQLDYHGDHGKECYKGFRKSLCHGWSVGPINYLIECVVGLKILEPGYKKIEIKPNLGKLRFVKATIPTPLGGLNIEIRRNKEGISIKTNDVKGMKIIK